jgi:MFS family permease
MRDAPILKRRLCLDWGMNTTATPGDSHLDSTAAWRRLAIAALIGTIGSIGMWSFVVALPAVQKDFGVTRGEVSGVYIMAMLGFAFGGVLMGKLSDRYGIFIPLIIGALLLGTGYVAAANAPGVTLFALAHFVLGLGTSASFAPLLADMSMWFAKRRGIAVALASCGNYLAGTLWPPLMQYSISSQGWRTTHLIIGAVCLLTLLPLAFAMRARARRAR